MLKKNDSRYQYYKNEWQWFTEPHEFDNFQIGFEALRITVDAAFEVFALWDESRDYDWRYMSAVELRNVHKFEMELDKLEGKARRAIDCDVCALARCISRETGMDVRDCLWDINGWYNEMYDLRFGKRV